MDVYEICLPCGQLLITLKLPELILFGGLAFLALISLFSKFNIISMMSQLGHIVQGEQRRGKPKSKKRKNQARDLHTPPSPGQNI